MPEISGMIQNYLEGSIATIGRQPVIQSKSITENGTYTAPEGVDGYSPITVNVPTPEPSLTEQVIISNGTYLPPEGYDGFSKVEVDVPTPTMDDVTITQNGTYLPASYNLDGFDQVVVNVPSTPQNITSFVLNRLVANQGGSTITYNVDSINTVWGGSSNIGCCINFQTPIRNKSKVIIDIGLYGDSYQHLNNVSTRNFNTAIGFTDIVQNSFIDLDNLDLNNHLIIDEEFNGINYYNQSNIHKEIDISSYTNTDLYLFFQIPGVTLTNLSVSIE